jgi:hypothetical protein
MPVSSIIKTALPFILIGGVVGALVGGALGDGVNGIRGGVIAAGVAAYFYLRRKKARGL